MQAFISWTRADCDVKNVIVERLQQEGILCWESDEYCHDRGQCTREIRNSQVFIVLIGDTINENPSGYVYNEIITAREQERNGRLNIILYKLTDAPLHDRLEMELNHIPDANHVSRLQRQGALGGVDLVVRRTKTLLELWEKGTPEKPTDVLLPKLNAIPVGPCGYFVEHSRDGLLEQMADGLEQKGVLILSELFGFGKRSLVRKYADCHRGQYKEILYLSAEGRTVREFFQNELEITNINELVFSGLSGEALIRKKLELLGKFTNEYLLILGGIRLENKPDRDMMDLLSSLSCHVILLTQDDGEGYRDLFPVIRVGRMSDEHLSELFFHHYDGTDEEEREKLQAPLYAFFEAMGGHTQTVELTATVLFREVGAYPEELPRYLNVHHDENTGLRDRIFDQIAAMLDLDTITDDERLALQLAALIAYPKVSEREFRQLLERRGVTDISCITALHRRRWLNVDRSNRIVSIEPLIAEICVQKLPPDYEMLCACVEHLEKKMLQPGYDVIRGNAFERAAHFYKLTDLPEIAEIFACLRDDPTCGQSGSDERAKQAVKNLLTRYPDSFDLEEADGENATRLQFEQQAANSAHAFIPTLQLTSEAILPNLLSFNATATDGGRARAAGLLGLDAMFGLEGDTEAYKEVMEQINACREDVQNMLNMIQKAMTEAEDYEETGLDEEDLQEMIEEFDETVSLAICMQTFRVIDDFSSKRYVELNCSLHELLSLLEQHPTTMEQEEIAQLLSGCFLIIVNAMTLSGLVPAAVALCDRLFALPLQKGIRYTLLGLCHTALQKDDSCPERMAEICEEMLELYDVHIAPTFADRREAATAKAQLQLMYIDDLLKNEECEKAADVLLHHAAHLAQDAPAEYLDAVDALLQQRLLDEEPEDILSFYEQALPENRRCLLQKNPQTCDKIAELQLLADLLRNLHTDAEAEQADSYYNTYSKEYKMPRSLQRRYTEIADKAAAIDLSALTEQELREQALELRQRAGRLTPEVIARGFALVSEAGFRVLGYRHHGVQYMGAAAMLDNQIAEILNGEGKTYTVILTAFIRYLQGKCVFIIDASPHLTDRNYTWMGGVLELLGLKVSRLHNAYDVTNEVLTEDYAADVIYTDFETVILNQHKNELAMPSRFVSNVRYDCAIIDEADDLLIDNALKVYQLVSPTSWLEQQRKEQLCRKAVDLATGIKDRDDLYTVKNGKITMLPPLLALLEREFDVSFEDLGHIQLTREIRKVVQNALYYCNHCTPGVEYYIHKGRIRTENKQTGRFVTFINTIQYMLQYKHRGEVIEERISLDLEPVNYTPVHLFLKKFTHLSGTTATATSYRQALKELYGLETVCIPPHQPVVRRDVMSPIYLKEKYKNAAVVEEVQTRYQRRQPVLLITADIEKSYLFDRLLTEKEIPHRLLNAKNAEMIAPILATAGLPGSVLIATAMAGRGVDIKLGGDPERMTRADLVNQGVQVSGLDKLLYRLPEQREEDPLYLVFRNLLLRNRARTAAGRQLVLDSGGLCVICTEFFSDPRLEQQARGRAGRQGEVGESIVFRSMEDDAFDAVPKLAERMQRLYEALNYTEESVEDMRMFNNAAQHLRQKCTDKNLEWLSHYSWSGIAMAETKARFLGTNERIVRGEWSPEEALKHLLLAEETVEYIRSLQKNPDLSSALRRLPEAEQLLSLPPRKVALRLFELLWQRITEYCKGNEEYIADYIASLHADAWKRFLPMAIAAVEDTVNYDKTTQYRQSVEQTIKECHSEQFGPILEQLLEKLAKRK